MWPSPRFPSCGPDISRRGERKTAHFHRKSPPVRMERAIRKGFIREGEGHGRTATRAPSQSSPGAMRLDTQPAAHFLSIEAFFWNPGGTVTGRTVASGRISGESRVEKEADGSWVRGMDAGAGLEFSPGHALPGPPSRTWAGLNRPPGPFPETNVLSGSRLKAGCACALSVRQSLRHRASKG
jgi:hypothetical protein